MKSGNNLPLFAQRLKELRLKAGLSQEKTADKLGCNYRTYRNWEKYGKSIRVENLIDLADLFNVSTDYLLGRTDYIRKENEYICESTGLSDKSVEVLRSCNMEADWPGNQKGVLDHKKINMLNFLIESEGNNKFEGSVLLALYFFIFENEIQAPYDNYNSYIDIDFAGVPLLMSKKDLFIASAKANLDNYIYKLKESIQCNFADD